MLCLFCSFCLTLFAAGCSGGNGSETPAGDTEAAEETGSTRGASTPPDAAGGNGTTGERRFGGGRGYGYTYSSASGDRLAGGTANLPEAEALEVDLGGTPRWVAGVATSGGTAWVAALENGAVEAFRLTPEGLERAEVNPGRLPPGAPPLLVSRGDDELGLVIAEGSSRLTHPTPLSTEEGGLLVVGEGGSLSVQSGRAGGETLGIPDAPEALPDARAVRGPDGDLAVLTNPTTRYDHGVLGDGLEAGNITVLRTTEGGARVVSNFSAESGGVFEGVAPLWFERGGESLLAVSESKADQGTRISVYRPSGELVTSGPFIGEGMRWRHLTAAAPFGPGGETELSATLTPHVGGVAQFYSFGAERLEVRGRVPGYSSHRISSRNLDAALAGDLDADGRAELLLPDSSYTRLGGLARTPGGAQTEWSLSVGGELSTNLAAATGPDGRTAVAAGRADGVLKVWR